MAKRYNLFGKLLGARKKLASPSLDIIKELSAGKLILVDSGIHSPVQYKLREITHWDELLEKKTVEIRSWSSPFGGHPNWRRVYDGDLSGRINLFGEYTFPDAMEDSTGLGNNLFHGFKEAVVSGMKTTFKARYHNEEEIPRIEGVLDAAIDAVKSLSASNDSLPLFMIELGIMYDTPHIRSLIYGLHSLGAGVVVVRLIDHPAPISDMEADIHIVERTPFLEYLTHDAEVILRCGTYAVVSPFLGPLMHRPRRNYSTRGFPSFESYNAAPHCRHRGWGRR